MGGVLVTLALLPIALAITGGIVDVINEKTLDPLLKAMKDKEESERVIIKLSYKDMMENKTQNQINVRIGEKEYSMSEEEFEATKQILKNNSPEEMSDCCGADVYPHRDHISRCKDCKEGCSVVYVF